ncbi:hypothetical protein M9980_10595 [Sphingomonas donggukensis]|uniref:Uncharacterized protein n=1 Tax=Sphingomonas donggukensis TaxID=2949093 RepID=A0ABY4TRX3_9SPHN|nr:hypothetical protein [Sphingomonas donggukensis]URW75007.1 hypothetical protein M9980_10595 [Sphingomonas donggukensis]
MVRIFCPVSDQALAALLSGRCHDAEADRALSAILALIRGAGPLGDFEIYTGVVELSPVWESFRPTALAQPVAGAAGTIAWSPTIAVTTWVRGDVSESVFSDAIDALLAAHPWEVPVIEISHVRLATRSAK